MISSLISSSGFTDRRRPMQECSVKQFWKEELVLVHEALALGISNFSAASLLTLFRTRKWSAAFIHSFKYSKTSLETSLKMHHAASAPYWIRLIYTWRAIWSAAFSPPRFKEAVSCQDTKRRDYRVVSWVAKVLDWTTTTLQHSFWIMDHFSPCNKNRQSTAWASLSLQARLPFVRAKQPHHIFWQRPSKHKGIKVHVHHSQRRPSTESQLEEVQNAKEQTSRLTGMNK